MPYNDDVMAALPDHCKHGQGIWRTVAPLIYFAIVEFHRLDQVLRQFGMKQEIPESCDTSVDLHRCDMRGRSDIDWIVKHITYVEQWNRRSETLVAGHAYEPDVSLHIEYNDPYIRWYRSITRRYITESGATIDFLFNSLAQIHLRCHNSTHPSMIEIQQMSLSSLRTVHVEHLVQVPTTRVTPSTSHQSPCTSRTAWDAIFDRYPPGSNIFIYNRNEPSLEGFDDTEDTNEVVERRRVSTQEFLRTGNLIEVAKLKSILIRRGWGNPGRFVDLPEESHGESSHDIRTVETPPMQRSSDVAPSESLPIQQSLDEVHPSDPPQMQQSSDVAPHADPPPVQQQNRYNLRCKK